MEKDRRYDVVIIGGGPAGLTAALYAGRARVRTVLLERGAPGGQLLNTEAIEDYPGFDHITGPELAQRMADQAVKFGVDLETARVTAIRQHGDKKVVETEDGEYLADFVILTAGGEPKKLGIPGEGEFQGRGVSQCAVCDGAFFKEEVVAVIGGGDAALEEGVFLTRYAKKVYIIHRREQFLALGRVKLGNMVTSTNLVVGIAGEIIAKRITGSTERFQCSLRNRAFLN